MVWKLPFPRLRVRTLILLVAVCAGGLGAWSAYWDSTGRLIRQLRADQPAYLRREAAATLGYNIPPSRVEEAISALILALRDPSPRVRECAVVGLDGHKRRARRAVPEVVKLLNDEDYGVRFAGASLLGSLVEPSDPERSVVVPALASALDDRRMEVRERAATSLVDLGRSDVAVDALARLLRDPDKATRDRVRRMIEQRIGPKDREIIFALLIAATGENMGDRLESANLLLTSGRVDEAMPILEEAAKHADPAIRQRAAQVRAGLEPREGSKPPR